MRDGPPAAHTDNRRAAARYVGEMQRRLPLPRPTELWTSRLFSGRSEDRSPTNDVRHLAHGLPGLIHVAIGQSPQCSLDCFVSLDGPPCMSELPTPETRPARLKMEASPRPPGARKPETELGAVSTTAPVPHPDSRSGPSFRICKVGLWTNNAPSSSASTYLEIASTFISDRQARPFCVPREGKGMDDLVIRLQGLSVALVVLEATGGFEATVAAALAGVGLPLLCR